jgi:hypothetical protein
LPQNVQVQFLVVPVPDHGRHLSVVEAATDLREAEEQDAAVPQVFEREALLSLMKTDGSTADPPLESGPKR